LQASGEELQERATNTVPLVRLSGKPGHGVAHPYRSCARFSRQMRERARSSFRVNDQTNPDSARCQVHPRPIEKVDVDQVMILKDGFHGYTMNGMVAALIVET
jgi:hypothetical protein